MLAVVVWTLGVAWSVYLVVAELGGEGGAFAVAVQALGSIGILYALFLVTRPRRRGVLEVLGVFRDDVVPEDGAGGSEPSSAGARAGIITITVALAIGAFLYRLFQDDYLHQSAAFFIGVPAVLAITLALTPKAKSATGMILKGLTLALLLSGVVFFEGFICILMAAPLFYIVGISIGIPIDRARQRKRSEIRVYSIVGVAVLLLSVEGIIPATTFPRRESIEVTRVIDASARRVRNTLTKTPRFNEALPLYLRFGFPRPVAATGRGLDVGDRRTIVFGTESPMEPMAQAGSHHEHHHAASDGGGELVLEIVRSEPGRLIFDAVSDRTAFTHWIAWRRSIVEWRALDADTTRVTWTLDFDRMLSPAWYFAPWQRYAGRLAAGYLVDTVATP